MHSNFLRVGSFFVQEHHIGSIQFNDANGTATVHAGNNSTTTDNADDIGVLRELVGDAPPKQNEWEAKLAAMREQGAALDEGALLAGSVPSRGLPASEPTS